MPKKDKESSCLKIGHKTTGIRLPNFILKWAYLIVGRNLDKYLDSELLFLHTYIENEGMRREDEIKIPDEYRIWRKGYAKKRTKTS